MADNTLSPIGLSSAPPPNRRSFLPGAEPVDRLGGTVETVPQRLSLPVGQTPQAEPSSKKAMWFAAGVGVTLVAVIGGGALIQGAGQPAAVQESQLSRTELRLLGELQLLDKVGERAGGGLKYEWLIGQRAATPEQAFAELKAGDPVYFYTHDGAEPIKIESWDQLKELGSAVRRHEVKREIREGIEGVTRGFEEAGKLLEKELEDFWKEVNKR